MHIQLLDLPSPRSERAQRHKDVEMKWALRKVRALIAAATAADRTDLQAITLDAPIPIRELESFKDKRRRDVFHGRFGNNGWRYCCTIKDGVGTLVFVGTHAETERFVDRYRGAIEGSVIPIEECFTLSEKIPFANAAAGPNPEPRAQTPTSASSSPLATAFELLGEGFKETVQPAIHALEDKLLAKIHPMEDELSTVQIDVVGLKESEKQAAVRAAEILDNITVVDSDIAEIKRVQAAQAADIVALKSSGEQLVVHGIALRADVTAIRSALADSERAAQANLQEELGAVDARITNQDERFTADEEAIRQAQSQIRVISVGHDTLHQAISRVENQFKAVELSTTSSLIEINQRTENQLRPIFDRLNRQDERLDGHDNAVTEATSDHARSLETVAVLRADLHRLQTEHDSQEASYNALAGQYAEAMARIREMDARILRLEASAEMPWLNWVKALLGRLGRPRAGRVTQRYLLIQPLLNYGAHPTRSRLVKPNGCFPRDVSNGAAK